MDDLGLALVRLFLGVFRLPVFARRRVFVIKPWVALEKKKKINMKNQMLALFHKDRYITKPFQILIDRLQALATGCSPAGQARSGDQ